MRNRLIELLNEADKKFGCFNTFCNKKATEEAKNELLNYLIENGVTCPPVNVRDKVYKITRNKVKECKVVFVGISADERCSYFNFVENYADGTFYKSYSMVFDVIGKSVFRTKEEAEKHLKGGVQE